MMPIPFHKTHITEDEVNAVSDSIRSGWLTMGPKTIQFEKSFGEYIGSPYSVSMNSATACLHLALKAIGLQVGDEVIIPAMTFIATAEVVTYFKAIPVLCDVDPATHNMDTKLIEALITSKTRAIIPVHFAGIPCDMDAILEIARRHKLIVIEDAAHAVPASYKGRKIGTIGDVTCFSFYATKTLVTGEGGMATTTNEQYADCMRINRLHGMNKDAWNRYTEKGSWFYDVVDNGCKYNMTDLNAALGLVQLAKCDWMRDERERIARQYEAAFSGTTVSFLQVPEDCISARHLFVIKVKNRDALIDFFKSEGIGTSVHFIPVHFHSYYKKAYGYQKENYPVTNEIFEQSLSLPIYPGLSADDISRICASVLTHAQ